VGRRGDKVKHMINGHARTVTKVEPVTSANCMTCGSKGVSATGNTTFYAPLRKGEGGLAVPRSTFHEHNGPDGTRCAASGLRCGPANIAALMARHAS
jgi:hypothetical protein